MIQDILNILSGKNKEEITKFSVVLDDDSKTALLGRYINKFKLTSEEDIVFVKEGFTSLAFFYDAKYDITTVQSPVENVVRNLVPRFFVSRDLWKIVGLLQQAAELKKTLKKELNVRGKGLVELKKLKQERIDRRRFVGNLVESMLLGGYNNPCDSCPLKNICKASAPKPRVREIFRHEEVYVSDHYVQIGSKIIAKNPNDIIRLNYLD